MITYKRHIEQSSDASLCVIWGDEFRSLPDHLRRLVVIDFSFCTLDDMKSYKKNIGTGNLKAYADALQVGAENTFRQAYEERERTREQLKS